MLPGCGGRRLPHAPWVEPANVTGTRRTGHASGCPVDARMARYTDATERRRKLGPVMLDRGYRNRGALAWTAIGAIRAVGAGGRLGAGPPVVAHAVRRPTAGIVASSGTPTAWKAAAITVTTVLASRVRAVRRGAAAAGAIRVGDPTAAIAVPVAVVCGVARPTSAVPGACRRRAALVVAVVASLRRTAGRGTAAGAIGVGDAAAAIARGGRSLIVVRRNASPTRGNWRSAACSTITAAAPVAAGAASTVTARYAAAVAAGAASTITARYAAAVTTGRAASRPRGRSVPVLVRTALCITTNARGRRVGRTASIVDHASGSSAHRAGAWTEDRVGLAMCTGGKPGACDNEDPHGLVQSRAHVTPPSEAV